MHQASIVAVVVLGERVNATLVGVPHLSDQEDQMWGWPNPGQMSGTPMGDHRPPYV